jgi:hypothetical protein
MKNLTTDEVTELYSTADHHSKDHARGKRNQVEFESWLEAHDAEVRVNAIEAVEAALDNLPDQMFWNRDGNNDAKTALKEHFDEVRGVAADLGVAVKKPGAK